MPDLAYLRTKIDKLDAEIAKLIDERAAMVYSVQRNSPEFVHDEAREREVTRLAVDNSPRIGTLAIALWEEIMYACRRYAQIEMEAKS